MNSRAFSFIKIGSLFAILFLTIFQSKLYAGHSKTKLYYDYSAFTLALSENKAQNTVTGPVLLLANELEIEQKLIFLPTSRLLDIIDTQTNEAICALFKLKTSERANKYYFSLPIGFVPTNRFYLRKGLEPLPEHLLNDKNAIKYLPSIFEEFPQKKLMLWGSISYGDLIEKQIEKIPDANKEIIHGLSSHGSLAKMIDRKRTDFAIMFPSELADFQSENHLLRLLSYRIEGVQPISTGHIMCNKTEDSLLFLEHVNQKLIELYPSKKFQSASTFSLPSAESKLVKQAITDFAEELKSKNYTAKPH